jgi:hypothetical protein
MADITITIQAASDATMTTDGLASVNGVENLAEDDTRRVYGLPNMYIAKGDYSSTTDDGSKDTLEWVEAADGPRWDTINPVGPEAYHAGNVGVYAPDYILLNTADGGKAPPTTTAFQLRADTVVHEFTDMVVINPMPAADVSDSNNSTVGSGKTGTPGQLNNIVLAIGQRVETIKLSGTLVDRGPVTAANPRRQILLNIARMQHFKIARTGDKSWGGVASSALNPRSYPCLTLFDSLASPGYSVPLEPSGDSRQYRGIIKDISFTLEGGRPDIWSWNMTFAVINNEHTSNPIASGSWVAKINRIRLVEGNDGDPSTGSGDASNGDVQVNYVEIRVDRDLDKKDSNGDTLTIPPNGGERVEFKELDTVYISNTNSSPTVNGEWIIHGIHINNRTFILKRPAHWRNLVNADPTTYYGEKELFDTGPITIGGVSVERFKGIKYSDFAWRYRYPSGTSGGTLLFTDGNAGYVSWGAPF